MAVRLDDDTEQDTGTRLPWETSHGIPESPEVQQHRDQELDDLERAYASPSATDRNTRLQGDDLQAREENPDNLFGYQEGDGLDAKREADRKEWFARENKTGSKDEKPSNRPNNRKRNIMAGGIAGGTVGIAMMAFGFLTPFKIPGIMSMVTNEVGQRVEAITTHRAKVLIARALLNKAGVKSNPVITGGGVLDSFIATLRTNKFEEKLAAKGLTIESSKDGVRLIAKDGVNSGLLKNEAKIVEFLSDNKLSNAAINQLVKEEIPTWRWIKRAKFAKWLRLKYNIPRFGREKTTEDADSNDSEADKEKKAVRKAASNEIDEAAKRKQQMFDDVMKIIQGDGKNSSGDSNETATGETKNVVKKTLSEKATEVKGVLSEASTKEAIEVMTKTGLKVGAQFASKAIPIYGWVMLYATVYSAIDVMYESTQDGTMIQMFADIRGSQTAAMYATYAGQASEYQLGEQDRYLMNYDSTKFDGIEKSYIFNCINKNYASGCDSSGDKSGAKVNENITLDDIHSAIAAMTGLDKSTIDTLNTVMNVQTFVSRKVARVLSWIDANTVGAAIGVVADGVGWVLNGAISVIPGAQDAVNSIKEIVDNLTDQVVDFTFGLLGMNVNTLAVGPELFTNVFSGGLFSMTNFCREQLKCHDISAAVGKEQDERFAQENAEYIRSKGILYALFSPEVDTSVTTQLAVTMPSGASTITGSSALQSVASILSGIPSFFASSVTSTSYADDIVSPASLVGMRETGFTDEELNLEVDDDMAYADGYDCSNSDNAMCAVDQFIMETIGVCADPANTESADCNPDAETSSSTDSESTTDSSGSSSVTASGFAWPFGETHWNNNKADYLNQHAISGSRLYANGKYQILGAASDISRGATCGTPIYSMYDGVVKEVNPAGEGGLSISSDINGKSMIIIYLHGSGVTVKAGDTVKAGQKIMNMDTIGKSTGCHLHIQFEYNNIPLCIQDLFLAMSKGGTIDLGSFKKATPGCQGRG